MSEPVTEIDARFSAPGASAVSWDETRRVLEAAELFWVCTVRAGCRPHVTPVVAVWLDGALYFATDPGEQKAVNLAGSPHVTLMTGGSQWDRGLDVVVEGDAVRVTGEDTLGRLAAAWAAKWDGRWHYQVGDGAFQHEDGSVVLVFSVTPAKVLAFGKGTFSHTRHRF